jgi:hypothetical protein
MNLFRRSSSRKNAKGVRRESSDNDLHAPREVEVRPCEWPHVPFMDEAGFHHEFAQFITNVGLTAFLADECEQYHILTNCFVQSFHFLSGNNPPEVSLIYMLKIIKYRLLSFVRYVGSPLTGI